MLKKSVVTRSHYLPCFTNCLQELRKRYADLDSRCRNIRANYARLSSTSQMFIGQMEERLQGLLNAYLRLLSAAQTAWGVLEDC